MRIPLVTAVVAAAALSQVGASPLRVEIIKSSDGDLTRFRYGHAIEHSNVEGASGATEITGGTTTAVRLSESSIFPPSLVHILRIGTTKLGLVGFATSQPDADDDRYRDIPESYHRHHGAHRHHHHHHHGGVIQRLGLGCIRNAPFLRRVHVALATLGPWEGRAVAFVLGCGIGVLIRMFWVLVLVAYRSIRGVDQDGSENRNDNEYTPILVIEEEVDDSCAPAPAYTNTDEKNAPKYVSNSDEKM